MLFFAQAKVLEEVASVLMGRWGKGNRDRMFFSMFGGANTRKEIHGAVRSRVGAVSTRSVDLNGDRLCGAHVASSH